VHARGLVGILAASLAAGAFGTGPAQAGSYDVVSCGAPGAGGVNRAWVQELNGFPPR
jgi:hypothetical protein